MVIVGNKIIGRIISGTFVLFQNSPKMSIHGTYDSFLSLVPSLLMLMLMLMVLLNPGNVWGGKFVIVRCNVVSD